MKRDLQIYGMHCKACELLITQSIDEIDWCKVNYISHTSWKLQVTCDKNKLPQIRDVIDQAWYSTTPPNSQKSQEEKADAIIGKLAWLLVAGVIVWAIMKTNVAGLLPDYENLTFSVAFIVGLVASISTCLAVTGWIVIGYAESVQTHKNWATQLKFHIGRFIAFVIGGWVLGAIGGQFAGSSRFNGIFSILVGIVLFYLGMQLLGILPNISKRWFHLPGWLSKGIFALKNPKYAPLVGALTFLLPCGFTQSMQLFALQSANPLQGALIMGAFALGTLPVLFGIGIGVKYIKDKLTLLNPLIAALLVAFGLYTMLNGYGLIQALNASSIAPTTVSSSQTIETIQIGHNWYAFVPETIELAAGKNYKLVVTPTSDGLGCFTQVVLPWVGAQAIKKWQSFEILVDGSSPKTIPLVCAAMGMSMGQIVVK